MIDISLVAIYLINIRSRSNNHDKYAHWYNQKISQNIWCFFNCLWSL